MFELYVLYNYIGSICEDYKYFNTKEEAKKYLQNYADFYIIDSYIKKLIEGCK